ncbi:MAG TPA: alpha/beta fold hydrolase [Solirubrobacteraceae bacterium]
MTERLDVDVYGGRLATYRLGANRADAPLVLAIHGITSTSRTWLATARALADRAALIAVDLRGRGRSSELPPPFGLDAHVRDVIAVLDRLGVDRAVVTGHSLGAYIAARLATSHPDRVAQLVLVDGGLTIPAGEDRDTDQFIEAFLGPTFTRLSMTFPDVAAYQEWWAQHPAVIAADVDRADLNEYAAHDLTGDPPELRSSINPRVVRDDGLDLVGDHDAPRLAVPAVLLCAPRGMIDDPNPMQPLALAQAWADAAPSTRRAVQVPDVNHYTIAWGARGARAVADEIARAVSATRTGG